MEVYLNDEGEILQYDETITVNETLEELEQSILSILAEDDSGPPSTPMPKRESQSTKPSDFGNHLCVASPLVLKNDKNYVSQHHSSLSPIRHSSLNNLYPGLSLSFPNCSSPILTEKLRLSNISIPDYSPTVRSPKKSQKENLVLLHDDYRSPKMKKLRLSNIPVPDSSPILRFPKKPQKENHGDYQSPKTKKPRLSNIPLPDSSPTVRSPKKPQRENHTSLDDSYRSPKMKTLRLSNIPLPDSSSTVRSPRKSQKENNALHYSDHRSPITRNSVNNVNIFPNSLTENIFDKSQNSPLKSSEMICSAFVSSPKLPLRLKNCEENSNTLRKPNYDDQLNMFSSNPSISCPQLNVCENVNVQNQLPKFTRLVSPPIKIDELNSCPKENSPSFSTGSSIDPKPSQNDNISLKYDTITHYAFQKFPVNPPCDQKPTMDDISKTITIKSSNNNNFADKVLPTIQMAHSQMMIQEPYHTNSTHSNETTAHCGEFLLTSNSSLSTSVAAANTEEDDVISLFADDDLEIKAPDSSENIDNEDNTNDSVQFLEEVTQVMASPPYLINQSVEKTSCAMYDPANTTLENGMCGRNEIVSCHKPIKSDLVWDEKIVGQTAFVENNLPEDLKVKASHQNYYENADLQLGSEDSQDSIVFIIEEMECEGSDLESGRNEIDDDSNKSTSPEKCGKIVMANLPVTQNNTIQVPKVVTAPFKCDKINESRFVLEPEKHVQISKRLSSVCKIVSEITQHPSESNQTENNNVSEDVTQVKKVSKPFKSADPEENKDIDHPEWENMKKLTTDEERYQDVRSRWKSKTVPNPNRDLTFHSFRKHRLQSFKGFISSNDAKQGQKRLANSNLEKPAAKRVRTKTVPCTYLIDHKIASTKQQFSENAQNVEQTYATKSQALNVMHANAESRLVANMQNGYNFQPYVNVRYTTAFQSLEMDHETAKTALVLKCDARMKAAQDACHFKLDSLENARQEIEQFCRFYKGLSNKGDGEDDPTVITENQMKELDEIENVYHQFKMFYKR